MNIDIDPEEFHKKAQQAEHQALGALDFLAGAGAISQEELSAMKAKHDRTVKLEAAIQKHLPALKQMASQVISPPNNVFSKMVADFEAALKP